MATIKSYTDLQQSKKLAEILPLESADMAYYFWENSENIVTSQPFVLDGTEVKKGGMFTYLNCWSLSALLDVLPFPQLSKDKLGSGKVGWMVSVYPDNCRYDSCWHDNPIDACYEMVLKLQELKLL